LGGAKGLKEEAQKNAQRHWEAQFQDDFRLHPTPLEIVYTLIFLKPILEVLRIRYAQYHAAVLDGQVAPRSADLTKSSSESQRSTATLAEN
jgi:hypothetical protein